MKSFGCADLDWTFNGKFGVCVKTSIGPFLKVQIKIAIISYLLILITFDYDWKY